MSALPAEMGPAEMGRAATGRAATGRAAMEPAESGQPAVPGQPSQAGPGPGERAVARGQAAARTRSRLMVVRSRPAAPKPRPGFRRAHPVGVRACSVRTRDEPVGAAPPAAATPAVPRPGEPSPLRLTRRGRMVAAVGAAVLAGLLCLLAVTAARATAAGAGAHGVSPGVAGRAVSQIVVQPGQTLWSIAAQADPRGDPRLVIQQILKLNRLGSENLAAGQRLWVPQG